MEPIEVFHDDELESLCGLFNAEQGIDCFLGSQFLGQCSSPREHDHEATPDPSSFLNMLVVNEEVFCSMNNPNSSDTVYNPEISTYEIYHFSSSPNQFTDITRAAKRDTATNPFHPVFPGVMMEDIPRADEEASRCQGMQLKRKFDASDLCPGKLDNIGLSENPKKKLRVSRRAEDSCKKASKPKMKVDSNNEENKNTVGLDGQSTSSYSSDDDNASGKTRASRGAATDPQSLYARKRRERINERLKILQSLVPNGTKVDISTMLEEAVHYVKFLQLQIKLLSSDDLWMYAPLAYNGLDIGLHQTFFAQLL